MKEIKIKSILFWTSSILILSLSVCKDSSSSKADAIVITPASLSYIATLSLGKVSLADKAVKSGEVFSDKPKLLVGDASLLDVQVKGLASDVKIRVKGGTDIQFYSRKKNEILEFIVFIKKGKAIFNIDKLNKNESVIVYTPISRNQVRGTMFDVVVNNLGDTSLHMGNGSVESAFTNLALDVMTETDLLPPDARRVVGGIRAVNTILESGNELNITSGDAEKVLRGLGLDEVANSPEFKTAGFFMDARLDEKNAANVLLEYSKGFMSKDQKQILESTQQIANALQLKNTADVETLIKEANEIVQIGLKENSSDEEIKQAVEEKIRANKDSLQTTVEKVYGKGSETIILRNGTKIRGVLDQRGNTFILKTAEGEVEFPGSQVKGYAF
jgi:hypothetical protein